MNIVWLGHSAFRIQTPNVTMLIDPFLKGNSAFPQAHFEAIASSATHIVLTSGEADHVGDTLEIAQQSGAQVLCHQIVSEKLVEKGCKNVVAGNIGGTLLGNGFSVTLVPSMNESVQASNGVVLHLEGGKSVYHMGDTDIFGDMALINELHQPQVGLVPIGDKFTMGPAVAALACRRYFNFSTILPCHYGGDEGLEPNAQKFEQAMEGDSRLVKAVPVGELVEL